MMAHRSRPRPVRAETGFPEPFWIESRGMFRIDVSLGSDPITKKRRRRTVYGATQRDARRAARRLQADYEDGTLGLRTSAEPKTTQELLSDWFTSPSGIAASGVRRRHVRIARLRRAAPSG